MSKTIIRLHWNWFGASACGYTTLILHRPFPPVVADTQPVRSAACVAAASRLCCQCRTVALEGSGFAGSGRLVHART